MRVSTGMLLFLGALAMLVALIAQNISLASEGYWGALAVSTAALAAAAGCCWTVVRRGGPAKWVAAAIALPGALVVSDWLRRLPYMLGLG